LKRVPPEDDDETQGARSPGRRGCISEGDTYEETLANIREAAAGWLEVAEERTKLIPETRLAEVEL
jgi:predicted RNase H-like HicB family nuclease